MKSIKLICSIFTMVLLVSTSAFAQEEAIPEIQTSAIGQTLAVDNSEEAVKGKAKKCKKEGKCKKEKKCTKGKDKKCKKEGKCKKGKDKKSCKEGCTKSCCAKSETAAAKSCEPGCTKACCSKEVHDTDVTE